MSKAVCIVDYGVGNLLSVSRAVSKVGGVPKLASDPAEIREAVRVILPGVGAFADCMAALRKVEGLQEALVTYAGSGAPLLGICVGMQVLFDVSEEFGTHEGLGLIPGRVKAIPRVTATGERHKVPHIGWAALEYPREAGPDRWSSGLLASRKPGDGVYFVHSFTAWPDDEGHRLADVDYDGCRISAAVERDNISGLQFHPEKSGEVGLAIVSSFLTR